MGFVGLGGICLFQKKCAHFLAYVRIFLYLCTLIMAVDS